MGIKRCPACKSEVPAEAADCPHCPYSFQQSLEAQKNPKRFGMASWHPAVWALIAIASMVGAWRLIDFVILQADPNQDHSAVQNFVDRQRIVVEDKNGVEKVISDGGESVEQNAKRALPTGPVKTSYQAVTAPSAAATAATARAEAVPDDEEVVIGPGGPAPAQVKEWRLRGAVFDLVTLKPIPHCTIYFTDPHTRARYETSSDSSGAYRTIVPPLSKDGYEVTFQKDGYARSYLNPGTENVSDQPAEDRKATAAELARTLDPPYEVQAVGAAPVKTDFYLAPLSPN